MTQPAGSIAGFRGQLVGLLSAVAQRHELDQREGSVAERMELLWLPALYAQVARGETEDALDTAFDRLDDLLLAGDFAACDSALRALDFQRLDTCTIVGVLAVTLAAADSLTARDAFLTGARRRLEELAPDRIEGLLVGLG